MICVFKSRSIEWKWVECAKIACHGDGLLHDGWKEGRKEGRTFSTLDSNPFNDMHSIFMLSVIIIMRIESKRIRIGWECDGLWFGIGFNFCI